MKLSPISPPPINDFIIPQFYFRRCFVLLVLFFDGFVKISLCGRRTTLILRIFSQILSLHEHSFCLRSTKLMAALLRTPSSIKSPLFVHNVNVHLHVYAREKWLGVAKFVIKAIGVNVR